MFISWNDSFDRLRGCLGSLQPLNLTKALPKFALSSALEDKRFEPLSYKEFKKATCSLSLLHSFVECSDLEDWEIGKHGIILEYDGSKATFLPEISLEHGWSKKKTLKEAIKKSGKLVIDYDKFDWIGCKLTKYQSRKVKMHYNNWKQ